MARTPTVKRMADRLMDGQLEETLRRYRKNQMPWSVISRVLHDEYGVEAGPVTLQKWAVDFGIEPVKKPEPENAA